MKYFMLRAKRGVSFLAIMMMLVTFLLSGCGDPTPENPSDVGVQETEDNYVATVNGEKVSQSEFYFFLNQTKRGMENQAQQTGNTDLTKFWTTKIDGKEPIAIAEEYTLNSLKEYKIGLIKAKEKKIELTAEEIALEKKSFEDAVAQSGGEEQLSQQVMMSLGISLKQYQDIRKNLSIIEKYLNEKQKEYAIAPADAQKFYTENKKNIDTATVTHVLFAILDSNQKPLPADKQELAKKNADEVLAQVKTGANITEIAKTRSEDPGVKQNNGEYTFSPNGQMVKEFEDWAFSKKVGDVGIVKTNFGYHVMKKTGESTQADGIKKAIDQLQKQQLQTVITQWKSDPNFEIVKNTDEYSKLKLS